MLDSKDPPLAPQWLFTCNINTIKNRTATATTLITQRKKKSCASRGRPREEFVCRLPCENSTTMAMTKPRSCGGGAGGGFLDERDKEFGNGRGRQESQSPFVTKHRPEDGDASHDAGHAPSGCRGGRAIPHKMSGDVSPEIGRSSRLADLPELGRIGRRHAPEEGSNNNNSGSETSHRNNGMADFSKVIVGGGGGAYRPGDSDAADLQRIQYEQSKKLIPVITRNPQRGRSASMGHIKTQCSTPPLLGKTSPISSARGGTTRLETCSSSPFPQKNKIGRGETAKNNDASTPTTTTIAAAADFGPKAALTQDRNLFFRSLKNKSSSVGCAAPETRSSSASASFGDIGERELFVPPPSDEEERFLHSLGWSGNEQVDFLTVEEIAEFKAQYSNKAATVAVGNNNNDKRQQQREKLKSCVGGGVHHHHHLRNVQSSSPVGGGGQFYSSISSSSSSSDLMMSSSENGSL